MDEMISYIFSTLHNSEVQAKAVNKFIKAQNNVNGIFLGMIFGVATYSYIHHCQIKTLSEKVENLTKEIHNQKGE